MGNKTNNEKKNLFKILKILLLIILVSCIGALIYNYQYIMAKMKLNEILEDNKPLGEDVYYPDGLLNVTHEYDGDISSYKVVLKSLEHFAKDTLPKYYVETKDMDDEVLTQYYERHKKRIQVETGMETVEEYLAFAKYLNKFDFDELVVSEYYVNILAVDPKYNRVDAEMVFLTDNKEEIEVAISLKSITKKNTSPIVYTAVTE